MRNLEIRYFILIQNNKTFSLCAASTLILDISRYKRKIIYTTDSSICKHLYTKKKNIKRIPFFLILHLQLFFSSIYFLQMQNIKYSYSYRCYPWNCLKCVSKKYKARDDDDEKENKERAQITWVKKKVAEQRKKYGRAK